MSHPPPPNGGGAGGMMMVRSTDASQMDADMMSVQGVGGNAHHFQQQGGFSGACSSASTVVAGDTGAPNTVKLSKIIACEIKGTMNAFSVMGPNAASWKPVEGKHASIFGVDDSSFGNSIDGSSSMMGATGADVGAGGSMLLNADLAAATNALRNVTITKATLLQSYNTFGVPLGVSVSCLPRNEVVDTGDKYTFTTIPNTAVNMPSVLYEAGETHAQAMDWMRTFGKYNAGNLHTQDVLKIPQCPYVFVHENHPVINLLRINKHIVGVDVDEQPKMDGQWHKITQSLFDSSCDTIKTRILSKIQTYNMNNLTIQLHRIGGVDWSHVNGADALMSFIPDPSWDQQTLEANIKAHEQSFTDKPCTFMARIQLEYEMQR